MRIGYLDCFSGISGDMFLGALVDAGVPIEVLREAAKTLAIDARLEARSVVRGGLTGTKVDVIAPEPDGHSHDQPHEGAGHSHGHHHGHSHSHHHHDDHEAGHSHSHDEHGSHTHSHAAHRSLSAILNIIDQAKLPPAVKEQASRAFRLLGEAEAAVHSIPIEQVHFHEVGAVDTIVDIVCAAVGATHLGVDRWMASAVNVGSGTVQCAHGILPVPAPATLRLLGDAPVYAAGSPMERITPTGAAILRMLNVEYAALPPLRVQSSGYGAGGRDTPGQPNLLRLMIGEADDSAHVAEPIAILETVIDDSTPQLLAYVSDLLLASGAWDVYRIPVQMKKGRTGVQLTVLCAPDRLPALRDILFRETTTIGAHWRIENKLALRREFAEVATDWGAVRIKIARSATGEVLNASPEYEDCRRIAGDANIPLKRIMQAALQAWSREDRK